MKTRKRLRRPQIGRGAVDDEPGTTDHPIVKRVLGAGGFGIVVGMPRLPVMSEMDVYDSHRIGEKIHPLIGVKLSFDSYKARCEEIAETIPAGEGRDLFMKLCFEVHKFYKPDYSDELLNDNIELLILSSFVNMNAELKEVKKVYEEFNTPEKEKVLKDAGILPLVDYDQVEILQDRLNDDAYVGLVENRELGYEGYTDEEYVDIVKIIVSDNVKLPPISRIPDYVSSDPGTPGKNEWTRRLFEKTIKFIKPERFDFNNITGGDDFYRIIKAFLKRGIHPSAEESVAFLSKIFTCISFPLAQKSISDFNNIIDGSLIPPSSPPERFDAITKTIGEMMRYSRNMLRFYEQGFVHNDLKPENVMMDHDGKIKFIDFGGVASVTTKTSDIELNIGSFSYPFWSFINVIRVIVDEMEIKGLRLTEATVKDRFIKKFIEEDVVEIKKRISTSDEPRMLNVHRLNSLFKSNPVIRDMILPLIKHMSSLRKTIATSYLMEAQFDIEGEITVHKVRNVLLTSFASILDTIKSPRTISTRRTNMDTINADLLRAEIALRNDAYSLGVVIAEYTNSLSKLVIDFTSHGSDSQILTMLRIIYEFLRFATACMSIDVKVPHSVWLPQLQKLAEEVEVTINTYSSKIKDVGTPEYIKSVLTDFKRKSKILPVEFPINLKVASLGIAKKRAEIQAPLLKGLLTSPLTSSSDYSGSPAVIGVDIADTESGKRVTMRNKHKSRKNQTRKHRR